MQKTILVNDKMQQKYRYMIEASTGKNFDPEFKPELSPKEMLAVGVFGGKYMTDCRSRQRQALLHWAYDSRKF